MVKTDKQFENFITVSVYTFTYKYFATPYLWDTSNQYWFATILEQRFKKYGFKIFYDTVASHFVAGVKDLYFDYNGRYEPTEKNRVFSLEDLQVKNNALYTHLMDTWFT